MWFVQQSLFGKKGSWAKWKAIVWKDIHRRRQHRLIYPFKINNLILVNFPKCLFVDKLLSPIAMLSRWKAGKHLKENVNNYSSKWLAHAHLDLYVLRQDKPASLHIYPSSELAPQRICPLLPLELCLREVQLKLFKIPKYKATQEWLLHFYTYPFLLFAVICTKTQDLEVD